jgi:hypothetical protein
LKFEVLNKIFWNTFIESIYSSQIHTMAIRIKFWQLHKTREPYTLTGFEPGIFCSGGGRDNHYATPSWYFWNTFLSWYFQHNLSWSPSFWNPFLSCYFPHCRYVLKLEPENSEIVLSWYFQHNQYRSFGHVILWTIAGVNPTTTEF